MPDRPRIGPVNASYSAHATRRAAVTRSGSGSVVAKASTYSGCRRQAFSMRPYRDGILFALLALMLMAGCAGPSGKGTATASSPGVNLAGFPPGFRDGYADGCNSARMPLGTQKDEPRFKSDVQYAQGWRDGYDICKKR